MAIGTAALILILSVYNGFDQLIRNSLSDVDPELLITPTSGKTFVPSGEVFDAIYDRDEVVSMSQVLEDDVFISYGGQQSVARAKGVDFIFEKSADMQSHILSGAWARYKGELPLASVGVNLAVKLGLNPRFVEPIEVYYPDRKGKLSPSNPSASLHSAKVYPGSIFSINGDTDGRLIFIPIETLREVLGYENEVSAVEIRVDSTYSKRQIKAFTKDVRQALGPDFQVLGRYQQHASLYKMMRFEKAAIYMILLFVVIIIAFNIFGSLSMLIIEKEDDIATLKAMGASDKLVRRIFVLEGWLISLLGMAVGIVLGVFLAWIQQRFGIVKMPGNFIVSAYPVVLKWGDVLLTAIGVSIIGLLVAIAPVLHRNR